MDNKEAVDLSNNYSEGRQKMPIYVDQCWLWEFEEEDLLQVKKCSRGWKWCKSFCKESSKTYIQEAFTDAINWCVK